jgi:hypothetical protein
VDWMAAGRDARVRREPGHRAGLSITGYENFTDFLPSELDDLEKLAQEKGIVQNVPPIPESAITRKSARQ